jgi:DNA-directed RNA polymerase specialized sigma24 family protein
LRRGRNRLTKHEKAFILNKVFGFAFREVAEVLGYAGPDAIQHTVNKMYQKYYQKYKEEFLKVEAT